MIRVKCPSCEKKLAMDDSKAGGIGTCPECGQKFRIPGTPPRSVEKKSAPAKTPDRNAPSPKTPEPRKQPAPRQEEVPTPEVPAKPRPEPSWDRADVTPYAVVKDPEPPPQAKKKRKVTDPEELEELLGFGYDKEYLRRRKKKLSKMKKSSGWSNVIIAAAIMLVVSAGLSVFAFLVRDYAYYVYFCMRMVGGIAGLVLRIRALTEGTRIGLLTLLPFADIYYGITRYQTAGVLLIIQYFGAITAILAFIADATNVPPTAK
jgi:hypothetical protein